MSVANPNTHVAPLLYQPLGASETDDTVQQIRLLVIESKPDAASDDLIRCGLKVVTLHEASDNFFALSYVWGDSRDTKPILVDGHIFQATKNLVDALRHVSVVKPASRQGLWVDAVCINQTDIPERNAQVKVMGPIYARAQEVLCWLGPADGVDTAAMALVRQLGQDLKTAQVTVQGNDYALSGLDDGLYDPLIAEFGDRPLLSAPIFSQRPYWKRIWTLQEVALSRACVFISGASYCTLDDVDTIDRFALDNRDATEHIYTRFQSKEGSRVRALVMEIVELCEIGCPLKGVSFLRHQGKDPTLRWGNGLIKMLNYTRDRLATDAHDKIYGLAGLLPIGLDIDYSVSVQKLYTSAAANIALKGSDLALLLQSAGLAAGMSNLGLPSWVPDWSITHKTLGMFSSATGGRYMSNAGCPPEARKVLALGDKLAIKGVMVCSVARAFAGFDTPPKGTLEHLRWIGRDIQFFLGHDAREIIRNILPLPLSSRPYTAGLSMMEAVFRAVVPETPHHLRMQPQGIASFIECLMIDRQVDKEMWATVDREWPTRGGTRGILERLFDPHRTETLDWKDIICEAARLLQDRRHYTNIMIMGSYQWRHVPFVTRTGYIGYAKAGIAEGDSVFVSGACNAPIIVRRAGGGYRFLTECVVPGALQGEVWKDGEGRERTVEEIILW